MVTVSSESTDRIGIPDISFTENKVPVKSSVTENNCPCEPCTSNIVEPDPSTCRVALGVVVPIPNFPSTSVAILALLAPK